MNALAPSEDTTTRSVRFCGTEQHHCDVVESWATPAATTAWADAVVGALGPGERAVASVSFDPDGPAIAHRVAASWPRALRTGDGDARRHCVTAYPDEAGFAANVREALARIGAGSLEKVVLGRVLDVFSEPPLNADEVVSRLLESRAGRYVFSVPLTLEPGGPVLLGASPELLVRRQGRIIASTPLAGSIPRVDDPNLDRERAQVLLESAKDLAEHAYVVEGIKKALAPICTEVVTAAAPELVATDSVWHLATPIRARLAGLASAASALHLARALQPTAAVGGVPRAVAIDTITDLEGDLRGPLAGAVGWVSGNGDGEFAVAIRAGVLHGPHLRLFAGAGIVAGSDPEAEVVETAAKLTTMSVAVGLR